MQMNVNMGSIPRVLLPLAVLAAAGCASVGGPYPEDTGDPCATARAELRGAENFYLRSVAAGAAVGAVTGALIALMGGADDAAEVATGVVIGGVAGALGGYFLAKRNVTSDAAELADSIAGDLVADNAEIDKATVAFAQLKQCRFRTAQQVKTDFMAGRVSREEAVRRLTTIQVRFEADVAIAEQVDAKMSERSREFQYASDRLLEQDPQAKTLLAEQTVVEPEPAPAASAVVKAPAKKVPAKKAPAPALPATKKPEPKPPVAAAKPAVKVAKARPAAPGSQAATHPTVKVANLTRTNQEKQQAFNAALQTAKAEAKAEFSLQGSVQRPPRQPAFGWS